MTSAQSTIKQLIDTFTDQGTVDPHLPRIQEYLTNLSTAAGNLAQASTAITTTVANHHDQLSTLRDNIQRDRTGALIAVGATVITAGLLWCLTVVATDGAGAAATGVEVDAALAATEAEIATAAAAITSDITASTFPALLADGAEIFSGIGQFTKADAQILAIQALVVAMASGDSAEDEKDRKQNPQGPGESEVWKNFKPYRGRTKTNGKNGKSREYYEWDYTHDDIEVYDSKGKHLGSMDPVTGEIYKPAVPGRTITVG